MSNLIKFESSYLKLDLNLQYDNKALLTITHQSPKIKDFFDFLGRMGKDHYLTKSGIRVAMSAFPEWKDSKNTLYLQGSWKHRNHITDTTRFVNNSTYRKNKVKLLEDALKEFVGEVRKVDNAGLLNVGNYSYSIGGPQSTSNVRNFFARANKTVGYAPARETLPLPTSPIMAWFNTPSPATTYKKVNVNCYLDVVDYDDEVVIRI